MGNFYYKAGYWHRGQCRRHRHSGVVYLSPVPEKSVPDWLPLSRYRIGSGIVIFVHSGTGLTGTGNVRHSGIDENVHHANLHYKRWNGIHPARSRCWWWKGYTLHVLTAGGGKRVHPACLHRWLWKWIFPGRPMSIPLVVERDTVIHHARPYFLWWMGYNRKVHTAGVERDTLHVLYCCRWWW